MKTLAVIALTIFACAVAQPGPGQNLFHQYAGSDNLMNLNEMSRFWLHFDDNGDGEVSKLEFDSGWRGEGYPHADHAPLYFLEMDRVTDGKLDDRDFPHIFKLFDENADGNISETEARTNGAAYFVFN